MLSIGVSYQEFWEGDYNTFPFIILAHNKKTENEMKITAQLNENLAFSIGRYVASSIGVNFSKKNTYPKAPINLFESERDKQLREEQENYSKKLMGEYKNLFDKNG